MSSDRRQFARALRKLMTRAEEILWAQLRGLALPRREIPEAGPDRPIPRRLHLPRRKTHRRPPDCDPGGRQATRMVRRLGRRANKGLRTPGRARRALHQRWGLRRPWCRAWAASHWTAPALRL